MNEVKDKINHELYDKFAQGLESTLSVKVTNKLRREVSRELWDELWTELSRDLSGELNKHTSND